MSEYANGFFVQLATKIVAGANMADREDLGNAVKQLGGIIGTGYYDDPDGDDLLRTIQAYLEKKMQTTLDVGEWRCRCVPDPGRTYDVGVNPPYVRACARCGDKRP